MELVGASTDEGLEPSKTPVGGFSTTASSSTPKPKSAFNIVVVEAAAAAADLDGVVRDADDRFDGGSTLLADDGFSGVFRRLELSGGFCGF